MSREMDQLLQVMAHLRSVDGCPWDREQTPLSLAPYVLEEAYEVVAAIESGEPAALRDELGDLLLQVVFHAQIAAEQGSFDFAAVAAGIRAKLIRRHPHLFAPDAVVAAGTAVAAVNSAAEQTVSWENIKAEERRAARRLERGAVSQLDDIPATLPAVLRANKLSKRAARVGFDFKLATEAADKVAEELREVRDAAAANAANEANAADEPSSQVCEEVGDLLFAAVNLARKLGVEPESALRAANQKFERRFRGMERLADERGLAFEKLGLAAQEELWQEMKRRE